MDDEFDLLQKSYRQLAEPDGVNTEVFNVIRGEFLVWVYFEDAMQKMVMEYLEAHNRHLWLRFWRKPKVDSFMCLIERLNREALEFLNKRGIEITEVDFLSTGVTLD